MNTIVVWFFIAQFVGGFSSDIELIGPFDTGIKCQEVRSEWLRKVPVRNKATNCYRIKKETPNGN